MNAKRLVPRVPPTPKAEETRRRILAAALDLFQERGFAETTMRDIARNAGVATGAAYYYFPSKEHLFLAVLQQHEKLELQLGNAASGGAGCCWSRRSCWSR